MKRSLHKSDKKQNLVQNVGFVFRRTRYSDGVEENNQGQGRFLGVYKLGQAKVFVFFGNTYNMHQDVNEENSYFLLFFPPFLGAYV